MHYRKLLAFLALALMLAFAGCLATPPVQPEPSQQNPPSQPPAARPSPEPEPQPLPAPGPARSCLISLPRSELVAGDEIYVSFEIAAPDSELSAYSCAGVAGSLGMGQVRKSVLCKFPSEGNYSIFASVGGERCASANVTVRALGIAPQPKYCTLNVTASDYPSRYYEARVSYSGYLHGDALRWDCDGQLSSLTIGSTNPALRNKPVSGTATVSCQFFTPPSNDGIPVWLGEDSCGSIPIR